MAEWLLVDGSSLIFRAYFGVPNTIRSPAGKPVNAVRGFIDVLARLVQERRPHRLAIATDEDWRPKFRVDLLPSYKSHRVAEPIPPELIPQMDVIWEVMDAYGLAVVRAPGFEAEDVIASLAAQIDSSIEIVSGDRDLYALVRDPDVVVLYPEGMGSLRVVDEAEIRSRYGIPGRAYADFAILRGDPSDGLPGLAGVGEKKAAALVNRYGSIQAMIDSGNLRSADVEYLKRAATVVAPVTTIPLELPDATLPELPAHPEQVERLKEEHGLGGSVERLARALSSNAR